MIRHDYPGKFIVIEGLDGSGKSAQVDLLAHFLRQQGKDVILKNEPTTESEAGIKIRKILKGEITAEPMERQRLFVQDRGEHLKNKIIPALQEGKFVLVSRYAFSTIAYGHSDGLNVDELIKMNEDFLLPDLTILIDVSPEECIERIEKRGETKELFERKEKLEKVNEIYKKLPEMFENVSVINGERPIEEVFNDIKKLVEEKTITELEKFAPIREDLVLSPEDRYLIEPFFTSLDSSVYGITFLPPEVIGALCSRASRAKDELRMALLNEFVKPFLEINEEELKSKSPEEADNLRKYSESLKALIDFLHKYPTERIFNNKKARDFYIKWLAQFGDDSIAQMAGTHLAYAGISQVAIKQIEDMRMGIAPIEKSTRYVDYSSKVNGSYRCYTDPTLGSMGFMGAYRAAMDNLFATYTELLAKYMEFLKGKYPGEGEKVLRTKAFDTVRLLLPVSTLSQLALYANGQAFEYMINRGLDHNLGEIRWSSKAALDELNKIIPAFLRRLESDDSKVYRNYLSKRGENVQKVMKEVGLSDSGFQLNQQSVKLLEYDPEGEDKIIAGLIYGESHDPFEIVLGKVKSLSVAEKEKILQEVLKDRKAKYYKMPRASENIYLRFDILMNIGAWRDLHRHRIQTQVRQRFTIDNGFDVPEGLKEAGLGEKYVDAIIRAEEVFRKIEKVDKDLAQYCCTLAHKVRFMQYQNMRAFFWEAELRTTAQGHPDYRKIEQEKARQIQKIYPLISKYLMVDMNDYDFARRGDTKKIEAKEQELKQFLNKA